MPSEKSLSSDDRDREDAPEIMERRALEEILYVILCFFSTNFIINKEDLFPTHFKNCGSLRNGPTPPSNDSKELWGDTQKIIRPYPFLGQPERVMKMMQWEETPRLGVTKDIKLRFCPIPFLGQPEQVMERMQWEETPRLGVTKDIKLRFCPIPFLKRPEGLWEEYQGKKHLSQSKTKKREEPLVPTN